MRILLIILYINTINNRMDEKCNCMFVYGPGGSGKRYLLNTLLILYFTINHINFLDRNSRKIEERKN